MSGTVAQWGERALLSALLDVMLPGAQEPEVGPGDDAAVVATTARTVVTVDSVVAGEDWLIGQTPPDAIGHRAAAVNLSDLAAMGATPRWAVLALELNRKDDAEDVLEAAATMSATLRRHGATVVGGDIGIGDGPQRWTLTLMGEPGPQLLTMSAAAPEQRVWLIGEIGQAALGLQAMLAGRGDVGLAPFIGRHLRPQPLVEVGEALAKLQLPLACTDVSDGLWLDAARLAEQSGVGMRLHVPRPQWLSPSVGADLRALGIDWRELVVSGGDDYALVVCTPWELDLQRALSSHEDVRVVPIGETTSEQTVSLMVDGQPMVGAPQGYLHGDQP